MFSESKYDKEYSQLKMNGVEKMTKKKEAELLAEIEALKRERDYWKEEAERRNRGKPGRKSKDSIELRKEICRLDVAGYTIAEMAKKLNYSVGFIHKIFMKIKTEEDWAK